MNSKILILSEAMVPFASNWGACQRIYHYAKKMVGSGASVSILCRNTSDRIDGTELVDGIKVVGFGGKTKAGQTKQAKPSSGGLKENILKGLQWIDQNMPLVSQAIYATDRFLYSEPNQLSGMQSKRWANAVLPFALQYIRENAIDTVILSGPAFGLFYHAGAFKAEGVKLVLDYRDPWISWYEKPTLASGAEKRAVKYADLVVTTTDPLTAALNSKYHTNKCHTVMNGYDEAMWAKIPPAEHNQGQLVISYVGNIEINARGGFRDASCFLKVASEFAATHKDVTFQFVGVRDNLAEIDPHLKQYVEFRNTVPVEESLEITSKADVLLILHTAFNASGKYIICGKAFDCMRSGNFILSIGNAAYANKTLVEENRCGIHCNNESESIYRALEDIYQRWCSHNLVSGVQDISIYARDYQNALFLQLIKNANTTG